MNKEKNDKSDKSDKFNLAQFNEAFDKNKKKTKEQTKLNENMRLSYILYKSREEINGNTLNPFLNLLLEIKNSWFYLLDELLRLDFSFNSFTEKNRLIYIGTTFLIISLVFLVLQQFLE